jgi:hypothetical protein
VTVAGATATPDPNQSAHGGFSVCDGSIVTGTQHWFVLPQSAGGPAIASDAVVEFHVCANSGSPVMSSSQIRVEFAK